MKSQTFSYLGVATIIALFVGLLGFAIIAPALADANGQANNSLTRVLIGFDKPVGASEKALVRAHGGKIKYSYSIVNAVSAQMPESALEGLARNPHITAIETDDTVYAVDIELDNSWGVKHIVGGDVHATPYDNKGAGVRIGIIDSGVNYYHPDLNDNFDPPNPGYDFYYYDYDPMDVYGHGTHVAGTAALIIAAGYSDYNGDGDINNRDVRAILQSTATDLGDTTGRDPQFGYGLVNALFAVQVAIGEANIPPVVDEPPEDTNCPPGWAKRGICIP